MVEEVVISGQKCWWEHVERRYMRSLHLTFGRSYVSFAEHWGVLLDTQAEGPFMVQFQAFLPCHYLICSGFLHRVLLCCFKLASEMQ